MSERTIWFMDKNESSTDTDLRDVLAENVRRIRTKLKLSQEVLAAQAGFHRTYVSQIEKCRLNISLDSLVKLAVGLQVQPYQLLKRVTPSGKSTEDSET